MRGSESKLKMDPDAEGQARGAGIRWRVLLRLPKSRCEDRCSASSPEGSYVIMVPVVCKA